MQHRVVNVYLTNKQLKHLAETNEDQVIETVDDEGGIFVHLAINAGDEGSGVWIDAVGHEHYGPGDTFHKAHGSKRVLGRLTQQQVIS